MPTRLWVGFSVMLQSYFSNIITNRYYENIVLPINCLKKRSRGHIIMIKYTSQAILGPQFDFMAQRFDQA